MDIGAFPLRNPRSGTIFRTSAYPSSIRLTTSSGGTSTRIRFSTPLTVSTLVFIVLFSSLYLLEEHEAHRVSELFPAAQFPVEHLVEILEGEQAGHRVDVGHPGDLSPQLPHRDEQGRKPREGEEVLPHFRAEQVRMPGVRDENAQRLPLDAAWDRVEDLVLVLQPESGILRARVVAGNGYLSLARRCDQGEALPGIHLLDEAAREAPLSENGDALSTRLDGDDRGGEQRIVLHQEVHQVVGLRLLGDILFLPAEDLVFNADAGLWAAHRVSCPGRNVKASAISHL